MLKCIVNSTYVLLSINYDNFQAEKHGARNVTMATHNFTASLIKLKLANIFDNNFSHCLRTLEKKYFLWRKEHWLLEAQATFSHNLLESQSLDWIEIIRIRW